MPRVSNFNETQRSGHIHKRGSKLGRTAPAQSALVAANYNRYLKNFYERVKARRLAGRAIIALPVDLNFWLSCCCNALHLFLDRVVCESP